MVYGTEQDNEFTHELSRLMVDVRTGLKRLTKKVDGIDSRVRRVESGVSSLQSKTDSTNNRVQSVANDVQSLQSGSTDSNHQINSLSIRMSEVSGRLERVAHDTESVKNGFTEHPFAKCTGQVVTIPGTTIKYPLTGTYSTNERCSWLVDAGEQVKVSFTKFYTESCCDHVEIEQGGSRRGIWSGTSIPSDLLLNGPFRVHFTSDGSNQYSGFEMELSKNDESIHLDQ